jgi:hypothetical protein
VGLAYSYDSTLGGYICTGRGSCTDQFLVIPDKYDDGVNGEALVLKIGESAFKGDTELIELVLPSHGAVVGNYGFENCKKLERVENYYPGGESEGMMAFYTCKSLTHVHFIRDGCISTFAFHGGPSAATYDFTDCTAVLAVLDGLRIHLAIGDGTQYLVPAALYDEWCAATNWSEYSHLIVAV